MSKENESQLPFINQPQDPQDIANNKIQNDQPQNSSINCCRCSFFRIPLFCCFLIIIGFFLFVLILALFIANFFMMKTLYEAMDNNYFSKEIIDPIINRNANFTQAFNVRIKALDDILLESKLLNMEYAINIALKQSSTKTENKCDDENYTNNIKKDGTGGVGENFISQICPYLNLFKENLETPYNIQEFTIFTEDDPGISIEDNSSTNTKENSFKGLYISYCNNKETQQGFVKEHLSVLRSLSKEKSQSTKASNGDSCSSCTCGDTSCSSCSSFSDFIVKNEYQFDDFMNYIKIHWFCAKVTVKDAQNQNEEKDVKFYVLIRMKNDTISSLYNKQKNNVTTILPVTNLDAKDTKDTENTEGTEETEETEKTKREEYHIFYGNSYLYNFFVYGTLNNNTKLNPLLIQFDAEMNFENSRLKTFYEMLYYYNPKEYNLTYNEDWRAEFTLMGQIIYTLTFDESKDLIPKNHNCPKKSKVGKGNIICEIISTVSMNEFSLEGVEYPDDSSSAPKDAAEDFEKYSKLSNKLYQIKYGNSKYLLNNSIFTNKKTTKSPTKMLIYKQEVNNLVAYNIELMDALLYSSIKEDFIDSMNTTQRVSNIILCVFCVIAFFASLVFLGFEINKTTQRIKTISKLKNLLFYKKHIKNYSNNHLEEEYTDNGEESQEGSGSVSGSESGSQSASNENSSNDLGPGKKYEANEIKEEQNSKDNEIINVSEQEEHSENAEEKENENESAKLNESASTENQLPLNSIDRWNKKNIYQKNFFEDGNKLIVKFTYDHLVTVLKNIDNYADEKFSEKLRFLRRKYKLNKEQEGKNDCQLASDIYQAISKIDMMDLKDVSYNVNYNQNYAVNQSFRMFKSILNNAENKKFIPLKNSKFINFEDILKIVYFIKKEKIQKLVNNIFDLDKKPKTVPLDEGKTDNEIVINTSMPKSILKHK